MSTKVYNVNVSGTKSIIRACLNANVSGLVYTSSTDVVFDGKPMSNGSEATTKYPQNPSEYNGYIFTKSMAEKLVLQAHGQRTSNNGTLRTSAIRPGHIYGPGDPMITIVLERVAAGLVPCGVGNSSKPAINDYVYVDNVAEAHVQCLAYLVSEDPEKSDRVGGEAFCTVCVIHSFRLVFFFMVGKFLAIYMLVFKAFVGMYPSVFYQECPNPITVT